MILKLAWRQTVTHYKTSLLFALSLGLGLLSYMTLSSFKDSVSQSIRKSSREYLSADMTVYARQGVPKTQLEKVRASLPSDTQEMELLEAYSMVSGGNGTSRLVLVKVIEESYPFYGQLELEQAKDVGSAKKNLALQKQVWTSPELLIQLGLSIGDKLSIGETQFEISDSVIKAPGENRAGGSFAPSVFISKSFLKETGLIQKGSTYYMSHLFKLSDASMEGIKIEDLEEELNSQITDPAVRVRSHITASEGASRLILYLNDYLGLVALVALFLSLIGSFYLFRSHLSQERKNIAILRSLGFRSQQIQWLYRFQLTLLGVISVVPCVLLSWWLIPQLSYLIKDLVSVEVNAGLSALSVGVSLLIAVFLCQLLGYPLLKKLNSGGVSQLFGETNQVDSVKLDWKSLIDFAPLFFSFWGLALVQANSLIVGSVFILMFVVAFAILSALYLGLSYLVQKFVHFIRIEFKLAQLHLVRSRMSSLSCFLAIGLGVLLISFIDQLEHTLQADLDVNTFSKRPSLFAFDIQEDQVDKLKSVVAGKNLSLASISPMIRGRLLEVNGEKFQRAVNDGTETREEQRERRSRNRGLNLSYRSGTFKSEEVVEGAKDLGVYDPSSGELPLLSVEKDYAKRLSLGLGDRMTFDIQGVSLEGKIANLRKVKWTSFQPNFFISFQPGVLDEAPKTFLATIPQVEDSLKQELQFAIVSALPNVSLIDVTKAIEKIFEIVTKMSWALKFMAYLCLVAGFFVLFSITQHQVYNRKADINLLLTLGLTKSRVERSILLEVLFLLSVSSLSGVFLSYLLAFICATVFFDGAYTASFLAPFLFVLATVLIGYAITLLSVRSHTTKVQQSI